MKLIHNKENGDELYVGPLPLWVVALVWFLALNIAYGAHLAGFI